MRIVNLCIGAIFLKRFAKLHGATTYKTIKNKALSPCPTVLKVLRNVKSELALELLCLLREDKFTGQKYCHCEVSQYKNVPIFHMVSPLITSEQTLVFERV